MMKNDFEKFGDILIKIGKRIKDNPLFINKLEKFLDSELDNPEKKLLIDDEKIEKLDLYNIAKDKTADELDIILSEFSLYELKAILKKYRFGVSNKLKTSEQIRPYIINQLKKRSIDVFMSEVNPDELYENTIKKNKEIINNRIIEIKKGLVNPKLDSSSGILLHFLPEVLLKEFDFNWEDRNQSNLIKREFRNFSSSETHYYKNKDGITGYTPDREYFISYKNGVIEIYKAGIERETNLDIKINYVKVDNLFYAISNFLNASTNIHKQLYKTAPPYYIFISLVNVQNTYFMSIDRNYNTNKPYPNENANFEPIIFHDLNKNIMPQIINEIHYSLTHNATWNKLL
jgi:hypothetical protein